VAGRSGTVNPTISAPVAGSYTGTDAMGPIDFMTATGHSGAEEVEFGTDVGNVVVLRVCAESVCGTLVSDKTVPGIGVGDDPDDGHGAGF
jgi:hypothetical protein